MPLPSQPELQALLDYNPLTGELFWKPRPRGLFASDRAHSTWNARYAGEPAFTAIDRKGYKVGAIWGVNYRASRVIYKREHGVDPIQVDHEDGDRQNNRLLNLRDVSSQDNQKNMKRASNNTSGTTGVTWDKNKLKWAARIKVDGKTVNLGRFNTIEEAIACRKNAETQHNFHPNHGR